MSGVFCGYLVLTTRLPQMSRKSTSAAVTYAQDYPVTSQAILVESTTYVDTEWLLSLLKAAEPLNRR